MALHPDKYPFPRPRPRPRPRPYTSISPFSTESVIVKKDQGAYRCNTCKVNYQGNNRPAECLAGVFPLLCAFNMTE
jgi:hypothetical protein